MDDQYVLGAADCLDGIGGHPIVVRNPGGPVQEWLPGSRQVKALVWMETYLNRPEV